MRVLIRAMAWGGYRFHCEGAERVPAGSAILVCNHVSFADWLFIQAALPRPVRFVMDHIYFLRPILFLLRIMRVIPIAGPREDKRVLSDAYARISGELARGELLCIFPEGRLTRTGEQGDFKPGIMRILKENPSVPVVPMYLEGLWGSFFSHGGGPPLRKWPRAFRPRVTLHIGAPLPPDSFSLAELGHRVKKLRSEITL